MSFSQTLKTWHDDRPKPVAVLALTHTIEAPPPVEAAEPVELDHIGRARQWLKDWVRRELSLHADGMSHEDRVKENP